MSSSVEAEILIKDFLKEIFVEKCFLEDCSMTSEEERSIQDLNINEVLENLKEIFKELMQFKKDYLSQDKSELLQRSEKFESMLQKLEAEVRKHIRVEHQLKLHIETNQSQAEELEQQNNKLLSQIKDLNDKIKNFSKSTFDKRDSKDFHEKIDRLEAKLASRNNVITKLEGEVIRLKRLAETGKENMRKFDGKSVKEKKEEIEEIKQKFEEKAVDLQKLEMVLRERSSSKAMKERNRSLRKSVVDNELLKSKNPEIKRLGTGKIHSRSTSEQMRPLSALKKRS